MPLRYKHVKAGDVRLYSPGFPTRILLGNSESEGIKRAGALLETPAQIVLINTAIDLRGRGRCAGVAYVIPVSIKWILLVGVRIVRAVIPPVLDAVSITVRAPTISRSGGPTITITIAARCS
jgi:hypothetical protein